MKNPYTITIFGQSYDGSNQVTVEVPVASSSTLGCVKPVAKTSTMTREVGVDSNGKLWTTILTVDSVVTSGSDHAVSSNAVWNYGNDLADSAREYVDEQLSAHETDYTQRIQEVQNNLDQTNTNVTNLTQRVSTTESDITAIESKDAEQDNSISQINTNITALQQKNTQQDTAIQQVQTNLDNEVSALESTIQSVKTEIETDYDEQISGLQQQITSNDGDITALQSGLATANQNISSNTTKINGNTSSITALQQRCTTIEGNVSTNTSNISALTTRVGTAESNIQTQTSRVNTLNATVSGHTTQITALQNEENGRFFDTEKALLAWVAVPANTVNLQVGAGLYVNNDNSLYYIWTGTTILRFQYLEVPDGGYMKAQDPTANGSISMNGNITSSYSAAFGSENTANGVNSIVAGIGMNAPNAGMAAFGSYNQTPDDREIFSMGTGSSDTSRKTAFRIFADGCTYSSGDYIAFDEDMSPQGHCDLAQCSVQYTISNMPNECVLSVNYDKFYENVTTYSDDYEYMVIYETNIGWSSENLGDDNTYYQNLSNIGISVVYKDTMEEAPIPQFVYGDKITIYAPPQVEISMRKFNADYRMLRLYVDADGDVCQEDL